MRFIPPLETASSLVIRKYQEAHLSKLLDYLQTNSPFYSRHFLNHDVSIRYINTLEDLALIPPTTKDDLQMANWDFLCVPRNKIAEYTSTSGTLGKPVTIALTAADLKRLAYNEYISFSCADGTEEDVYQLMLTLDRQFMAGVAYYAGIQKLGAGVVRVGPGLPAMQWETIERLQPTVLVGVPSFMVKLLEYGEQQGIDIRKASVKKAICIGENIRNEKLELNSLSKRISELSDLKLYSTYASTEMQTAFTECSHGLGGHHHPELLIVELLDEHNNPVPDGEPGEVVITTLGVEGMPLLRYKTGDIAIADNSPCACGRTTTRLGPIIGRKQQMIKLKGTTLYPPGVFEILNTVSEVKDYVVEVSKGELEVDELKIFAVTSNDPAVVQKLVVSAFQSRLRVAPDVAFVEPAVLEKMQLSGRKAQRFIDKR